VSAGSGKSGSANEPFVETPAGGLFFLNAVLALVVVRGLLRGIGAIEGPTALLDPVPAVAAYAGPWIAWLSVVPLWTSWHNLRMPLPSPARCGRLWRCTLGCSSGGPGQSWVSRWLP